MQRLKKAIFNIRYGASIVFSKLLSFIVGGTECIVCGKNCIAIPVCKECGIRFYSVSAIDGRFCSVCGKTLISEQNICTDCRNGKINLNIDGIFPLFSYRLWNTRLLSAWKRNNERVLSPFFCEADCKTAFTNASGLRRILSCSRPAQTRKNPRARLGSSGRVVRLS